MEKSKEFRDYYETVRRKYGLRLSQHDDVYGSHWLRIVRVDIDDNIIETAVYVHKDSEEKTLEVALEDLKRWVRKKEERDEQSSLHSRESETECRIEEINTFRQQENKENAEKTEQDGTDNKSKDKEDGKIGCA